MRRRRLGRRIGVFLPRSARKVEDFAQQLAVFVSAYLGTIVAALTLTLTLTLALTITSTLTLALILTRRATGLCSRMTRTSSPVGPAPPLRGTPLSAARPRSAYYCCGEADSRLAGSEEASPGAVDAPLPATGSNGLASRSIADDA